MIFAFDLFYHLRMVALSKLFRYLVFTLALAILLVEVELLSFGVVLLDIFVGFAEDMLAVRISLCFGIPKPLAFEDRAAVVFLIVGGPLHFGLRDDDLLILNFAEFNFQLSEFVFYLVECLIRVEYLPDRRDFTVKHLMQRCNSLVLIPPASWHSLLKHIQNIII